ncbi:MAG: leucine-rich repeat domain-containing protein [Peptostreptococcaceae bacterium]
MLDNNDSNWINKHLRFVLAKEFNRRETEITKAFLSTLEELDLSERGLSELKGLQFANNLISLNLNKNNIKNANHLKNLSKLTNLEICENKIDDINFLINLKKLKTVDLEANNISYVPNISNLKNLVSLNISNNNIGDLSFIEGLHSKNIKIIATKQLILLKPILVHSGSNYNFSPNIYWDKNTPVLCDNIQVTGDYDSIETDERVSLYYSISKAFIKNITSDCLIKADFYHEVSFSKSGILSGVIIQPLIVKLTSSDFSIDKLKRNKSSAILYGKISLKYTNDTLSNILAIKSKTITLISSNGEKITCLTNANGEYQFQNMNMGRYTLLFPFINDYKYLTPSLYLFNIKEDDCIEVNVSLIKE